MPVRAAVLVALLLPGLATAQYDPNQPPSAPSRPARRPPPPPPPPASYGPGETGLTLGARFGFAAPAGEISGPREGDPRLDDLVDSKLPIWLELGFRFGPTVWGGLYLELAPVYVSSDFCLPGRGCDATSVRFGVDVQFHLAPHRPVDPWVGIGFGAEFVSADAYDASVGDLSTFGYGGFELPLLEAGVDLALSPRFTLGPYVSWSVAQYTSYSVETPGFEDLSGRIRDRSVHGWLQLGVKGTFKL